MFKISPVKKISFILVLLILATEFNFNAYADTEVGTDIDLIPPLLEIVSVASDNSKLHSVAKAGDTITVSITSNEDLKANPVITIANNTADVSGSGRNWEGTYRMKPEDSQGTVAISVEYQDIAGNSGAKATGATDGTSVIFDSIKPVISLNGAADQTISLGSPYNETVKASDKIDSDLTPEIIKSGSVDTGRVGTYIITYNVEDAAGNKADPETRTIHVGPLASGSVITGIVGKIPKLIPAGIFSSNFSGDTLENVKITRLPGHGELKLNGAEVEGQQVIPAANLNQLNYVPENFNGEDSFGWQGVGVSDIYSNVVDVTLEVSENSIPQISGSIQGVPSGHRYKGGSQIALSWEAAQDSDNDGQEIIYALELGDGNQWREIYTGTSRSYTYTVSSEENLDNIRFRLKAVDGGGFTSTYIYSSLLSIDNTPPVLSDVNIKSSGGTGYAKTGDKITLTFTASEALKGLPVVKIGTKIAALSAEGNKWTAVYTMASDDAEGIIEFSIEYTDMADTDGARVSATNDNSQVIFDRTKPVIALNSNVIMDIEFPGIYIEPGAEVTDNLDALIDSRLIITGEVQNTAVGNYIIKYNVTDAAGNEADEVTRTVRVKDSVKPVIKLDRSEITIEVHSDYVDSGITVTDNYDDEIAEKLVKLNPVNKDIVGDYTIKYNVTDSSGNKADEVRRTVHVVDTTAPVINLTGGSSMTIEVGSAFTDPGFTVTENYDDNAAITSRVVKSGTVNTEVVGAYTINYDVSDSNGNMAEHKIRTVNVVDRQTPVITMIGGDEIIEVHTPYIDKGATAADNYDGNITGRIIAGNQVKANVVGTYYVTYDVRDSSGNSAVQMKRKVVVQDTTKPIISLKGVSLGGNSDVTIQVRSQYTNATAKASAIATDNYDGNLSDSIIVGNPVNTEIVGTYTVTFNVTDENGNQADPVTRKVKVVDTEKPKIYLKGAVTAEIPLGTAYTDEGAVVKDNYDEERSLTGTGIDKVKINEVGTYYITFNATDSSGNIAEQVVRTVKVIDVTKPVITLNGSSDMTIEVHGTYIEEGYSADDPDDGNLTGKVIVNNPVIVDKVGVYTITYDVTEPHGNKADQVTRTVRVVDTTAPVISLKGKNIITGSTTVNVEAKTSYIDPGCTATDNYDGDLTSKVVVDASDVNINLLGDYTARYNVRDEAGNTANEVTRTVHVQDTGKPVLALKGDAVMTIEQGQSFIDPGVHATDNYETPEYLQANLQISNTVNTNVTGIYVLVYKVSDSSHNAAKAVMRTVYVTGGHGDGPDLIVDPYEVTVEVKGTYDLMTGVTATTSGGAISVINMNPTSVDFNTVSDYAVIYTAVQDNGASRSRSRIVHVVDTTSPVLEVQGDPEVTIDVHSEYDDEGATAADNYDAPDSLQIYSKSSVVINQLGSYTVKYNVTDSNGNKADEIERKVNVIDRVKPVITLLGALEQTLEAKGVFNDPGAVATDNYDKSCTVQVSDTLDMSTWGDYTLTYTAVDSSGNIADEKTRIIHVRDTKGPVITLTNPGVLTLEVHNDYVDPGAAASDNYDGGTCSVTLNTSGLNKDVLGTYTISYTAQDLHNNTTTFNRTVRVVDTTKPVITLKGDEPAKLEVHMRYNDAGATALDNVDGDITDNVFVVNPVISDVVGTYTVSYSVKDAQGNESTAQRTVNIVDETKPVITLNGASQLTILLNSAYNDAGATATDNYDGDITRFIIKAGTVNTSVVGTYTLTYNVEDANHNIAAEVTRTVYVQPAAASVSKDGVQNAPIKFTLEEFAAKFDGDTLTSIKISTLPSNGVLKLGNGPVSAGAAFDGTNIENLRYIPSTGRIGKDSFSWTGVGAEGIFSEKAAVNIDIKVNYAPTMPGSITGITTAQTFKGGSSVTVGWGASTDSDGNLGEPIEYIVEFNDGSSWSQLVVQKELTYTLVLPELSTGAAKFRVKARDAGGLESAYNTVNFEIDYTAPVLDSVNIRSGNARNTYAKSGDMVYVSFVANEALKASPAVTIAGHTAGVTGSGRNWTGSYKMTDSDEEKIIEFTINFEDLVGNTGTESVDTTDASSVIFDRTIPVITIIGTDVTITYGDTYTDAGATAEDSLDGTIACSAADTITSSSPVGVYNIIYSATDMAGNSAVQMIRKVTVRPRATDSTKSGTQNITMKFAAADFVNRYANDTLAKITITQLPSKGILYNSGSAVTTAGDILKTNLDKLTYVPETGYIGTDSIKWTAEGNKGITSSEATMTLNIVKNNPPSVPQNVSGVSQGQKVKGGSSVTISWNASTDPDNGGAALSYILEFTTDGTVWNQIYSGTATSFNASLPVIDVTTAQFRVKARDAGGFESGYGSSKIFTIDSTAPVLTVVSIASNNANSGLAKVLDTVTVQFEADEDLSALPVVTVDGKNATVTGSGKVWTANYIMTNTDVEGDLPITISYKDIAGNQGMDAAATLDSSKVIFDSTKPVITINGFPVTTIGLGDDYQDQGAEADDSRENDISSDIVATNTVNSSEVGRYTVIYNVSDSAGNAADTVIRDVYVQPVAKDDSVNALGNITFGFETSDFSSNLQGDSLVSLKIISLPERGTLKYDSSPVASGDEISNISKLTYISNDQHACKDSFAWNATGVKGIRSTQAIMNIDVEENYPPSKPGPFNNINEFVKGGTPINVGFAGSTDDDGDGGIPMRYILEFTSNGQSWSEIYRGTETNFIHNPGTINTNKAQYRVKALDGGNLESEYAYSAIFTIDSIKPVIVLKGLSLSTLEVNRDTFTDAGVELTDNFDSKSTLENALRITGIVNVNALGNYTLTYSVADRSGNEAVQATRTILVRDREKPVLTLLGAVEINVELNTVYNDAGVKASDNYDSEGDLIVVADNQVNTGIEGDYLITYDVTDSNGNEAVTVTRTVHVQNNAPLVDMDFDDAKVGYNGNDNASSVTQNVILKTSGPKGSTITWQSSTTGTISSTGIVNRPEYSEGDKNVKLTATITKGGITRIKEFLVTVIKKSPPATVGYLPNVTIDIPKILNIIEKNEIVTDQTTKQIVDQVREIVSQPLDDIKARPLDTELNSRKGAAEIDLGMGIFEVGEHIRDTISAAMSTGNADLEWQLNMRLSETDTEAVVFTKDRITKEDAVINVNELKDYTWYTVKVDIVVNGKVVGTREKKILTPDRTPPVINSVVIKK